MYILFWIILILMLGSFASTYLCVLLIKDEKEAAKWAWRMIGVGLAWFILMAIIF